MNEETNTTSADLSFSEETTHQSETYGHWEIAKNITKNNSSAAFTYIVWFPEIYMFYIGVKKLFRPNGDEYKWRSYTSSSKAVNKLIQEGQRVEYLITNWFDDFCDAISAETSEQLTVNAHKNPWCLNKCITGDKFFTPGPPSSETKKRMSRASKGRPKSATHRANISACQKGKAKPPVSVTAKINLSNAKQKNKNPRWRGYVHSPDGVFDTTIDAGTFYNTHRETIRRRCESTRQKWSLWFFSPSKD